MTRDILELPAGARPGERPEWVRDRRATALVFGEQTWDLSWTHPCGSPQSNSSHLLRIVMYHVFFQWQTSSWAVLICGMSPNTLDRQPFHFSRRRRTYMLNSDHPVFSLKAGQARDNHTAVFVSGPRPFVLLHPDSICSSPCIIRY